MSNTKELILADDGCMVFLPYEIVARLKVGDRVPFRIEEGAEPINFIVSDIHRQYEYWSGKEHLPDDEKVCISLTREGAESA